MRRPIAATAILLCAAALIACSPSPGPHSGCDDDVRTAGAPGDAEPLLVFGDMGFTPTIVYEDGAVIVPLASDAAASASVGAASRDTHSASARGAHGAGAAIRPLMAPGYTGPQPGGFVGGSLTACQLAAVASRADALFAPSVDFGEPLVTDSGSTDASYRGQAVSVYAFTRADPTQWDGLAPGAQRARQDLADLWDLVEGEARLDDVLPITRLHVRVLVDVDDDELVDWPLSTPLSDLVPDGCATLDDPEEVAALVDRLDDDHPLLETAAYRLAILAAAPGSPACDP